MARLEKLVIRGDEPPTVRERARHVWDTVKRSITLGPYNSKDPALARHFGGSPSSTGIAINEFNALDYSAVWGCVSGISKDVAVCPQHLYRHLRGGGKERLRDHPVARILRRPNPEMSAMTFRSTMQSHALTWGNAYAEVERDAAGRPFGLWPLPPDRVTPFRDAVGKLKYRVSNSNGSPIEFDAKDIVHIRGLSGDGLLGYSVVRQARESLGLLAAAEKFGAAFYGNGSTFGGVLSSANTLSDKSRENLRASVEARHQGVSRAHRLMLLEDGISFTPVGVPPADAQFLESRKFQVAEVARWFSYPLHRLQELDRATFSNIEEQNASYYTGTLLHWYEQWEQELSFKLISPSEQNVQFIEHVVEQFLRGDSQKRGEFYTKLFYIGAISTNEIRAKENLNPIPGGDQHFVAVNMRPIDQAQVPTGDSE